VKKKTIYNLSIKNNGISKNFRELKKDRKSFCEKDVRYV
jgi:hypothetical protein